MRRRSPRPVSDGRAAPQISSSSRDAQTRACYAQQAIEHGWSRSILVVHIESGLHKRTGKALTNFKATLPPPQSDLAQETLEDPYVFDFLALGPDALEQGLIDHVQRFLMEMGVGIAFVGRQPYLEVDDEDFYVDLLLYHLKLRCFVVIDLKAVPPRAVERKSETVPRKSRARRGLSRTADRPHAIHTVDVVLGRGGSLRSRSRARSRPLRVVPSTRTGGVVCLRP